MGVEKGLGRRGFLGGFAGLTTLLAAVPSAPAVTPAKEVGLTIRVPPVQPAPRRRICVMGIGGAGCNTLEALEKSGAIDAKFIYANTDLNALHACAGVSRLQLGRHTTEGLGASATPEIGRHAAEEAADEIRRQLEGGDIVFLAAGMGGGTGTGSSPVVARIAREMEILTVAVVTTPFHFEGAHRMRLARHGTESLRSIADTTIVVPNQNLFRISNEKTTFAQAFRLGDDILHGCIRTVADLMSVPGMVSMDFADVAFVLRDGGGGMAGVGEAEGDRRALDAAEAAIHNPMLEEAELCGATRVLVNVTGGRDLTLYEVDEAANRVRDELGPEAIVIFATCFDEKMVDRVRVSVIATGLDSTPREPI